MFLRACLLALAAIPVVAAQNPFIALDDPVIALTHVRVIDGTGTPARADQTIVIDRGNIAAVGDAASTQIPAAARQLNLAGHTVYPGLVGMHEHLFYPSFYPPTPGMPLYAEQAFSAPRIYLAS
jgi:imidazolonepropionase-like amidohydrolase